MVPLAHSPRRGVPPQPYAVHVDHVRLEAVINAREAVKYYGGDGPTFMEAVEAGAVYHDLGKLDKENQDVLSRESRDPLPRRHEDAGIAELSRLGRYESRVLVAAHHAGLFSNECEREKGKGLFFRIPTVAEHVNARLDDYLKTHRAAGCPTFDPVSSAPLHRCGFARRLALSCLVDADHGDTAKNYGQEVQDSPPLLRWEERIAALERYVSGLPQGETDRERRRNHLRRRVYEACRDALSDPCIRACDAAVGSGKTTAVMAHLLRVAQEKELRHIFVVLPYTNIIKQSVEVYRKALVLPGERPEDVVAEHHHQADFQNIAIRQLTTLWRAPIIVTTAVQFFETLASHRPARLRKLHELPGMPFLWTRRTPLSRPICGRRYGAGWKPGRGSGAGIWFWRAVRCRASGNCLSLSIRPNNRTKFPTLCPTHYGGNWRKPNNSGSLPSAGIHRSIGRA